jgi:hypothetical protein
MISADTASRRLLAVPFAVGLVFALVFVFLMTSALHAPAPHGIHVGLVAPAPIADRIESGLAARAPGAFALHRYGSDHAARQAIDDRQEDAAFVVQGGQATLLLAGATGTATTTVVRAAFTGVAGGAHLPLTVQDVKPLPATDPGGTLAVLLLIPLILASVIASILGIVIAGSRWVVARLGLLVAYAAAVGFGTTLIVDLVAGGLSGSIGAVTGVTALFVLAMAGAVLCLHRLLGAPGAVLAIVVVLMLGIPASGAFASAQFLPDFYRVISPLLPAGAAVSALRDVFYFGGNGAGWPLTVLACWAGGSMVLILIREATARAALGAVAHA